MFLNSTTSVGSSPALLTTSACSGDTKTTQSFLTSAIWLIAWIATVLDTSPNGRRDISNKSSFKNVLSAVVKFPSVGLSEDTPPINETVKFPLALFVFLNVVPAAVEPQAEPNAVVFDGLELKCPLHQIYSEVLLITST